MRSKPACKWAWIQLTRMCPAHVTTLKRGSTLSVAVARDASHRGSCHVSRVFFGERKLYREGSPTARVVGGTDSAAML